MKNNLHCRRKKVYKNIKKMIKRKGAYVIPFGDNKHKMDKSYVMLKVAKEYNVPLFCDRKAIYHLSKMNHKFFEDKVRIFAISQVGNLKSIKPIPIVLFDEVDNISETLNVLSRIDSETLIGFVNIPFCHTEFEL